MGHSWSQDYFNDQRLFQIDCQLTAWNQRAIC